MFGRKKTRIKNSGTEASKEATSSSKQKCCSGKKSSSSKACGK